MKCLIENCNNKSICKKLCQKHYDIFRFSPERKLQQKESNKKRYERMQQQRQENSELDQKIKENSRKKVKQYRIKHKEKVRQADNLAWRKSPKRRYNRSVKLAAKRKIEWNISLEDYLKLIDNFCYYDCGNKVSETGVGLDRKNNKLGYILTNIVPCCGPCNIIKNKYLSAKEMKEFIKILKISRNTKVLWDDKNQGWSK